MGNKCTVSAPCKFIQTTVKPPPISFQLCFHVKSVNVTHSTEVNRFLCCDLKGIFPLPFCCALSKNRYLRPFSLFTEEPASERKVNAEPSFIKECRNTYPRPRGSKEELARCDVIYFSVSDLPYTYISQEWRTCFTSFRVPFCFGTSWFTHILQSYFTGAVVIKPWRIWVNGSQVPLLTL